MNVKWIGVMASVATVLSAAARADVISGLEVHYAFENADNMGENSVGMPGVNCG